MGRWTQYDEDTYRLPEGMTRTGYDADTGRYYFTDKHGGVWQGEEGAEFGEMTRVSDAPSSSSGDEQHGRDIEEAPTRPDGYQLLATNSATMAHKQDINAAAYRTLLPFFLIVGVALLLIWRLVLSPGLASPVEMCPSGTIGHWVHPGDTCWDISATYKCSLEAFKALNPKIDCESLMPGTTVCVPGPPLSG
ncbi:carbohydrate-binding module family 50 protein [Infundibulicybe gibba]|nr:carbohydrate-binding module family 50 protein [Infundibulicybe gibba]